MNLIQAITKPRERSIDPLPFEEYLSYFSYGGVGYPIQLNQTLSGDKEEIGQNFEGYVQGVYKTSGVVFAVMLTRMLLFSEARFKFRQLREGRPGDLFGTAALGLLEHPWPNGTTGDLLMRAIQDVDLAGNAFFARVSATELKRLRPDWVTIILGSGTAPNVSAADPGDLDAHVIGYSYQPGGPGSSNDPVALRTADVAHFAPNPDPIASYRGMSWLQPVVKEILGDTAASTYKGKYFENGATPNMVVKLDATIQQEAFEKWVELFEEGHKGAANAFKTLYLGAGADATVVGSDLRGLDFKSVQGHGETRIAAAGGVPPVIVGLSEGLEASTYSNYAQARRRFADGTMRPLWRNASASFAPLVEVPGGSELWFDDRDIAFLQEDLQDRATIQQGNAIAIKTLIDAGFNPQSAVDAVVAGDLNRLNHTGLVSVQLQAPGAEGAVTPEQQVGRALAELVLSKMNEGNGKS